MPTDTRSRNPIVAWFGPAFILILLCSASAQITADSSMTENHDATWGRSTRVTQTRVEVGGRTIATQIVERPSVNGDYTLVNAIETETSHDGAKTHVTECWYVPDGNGRRQLSRIIETDTTALSAKSTTSIRTRYDSDLDGHLQPMERDIEEFIILDSDKSETTTTVFLLRANAFVPVQQTVTVETRKENGLTHVQRTVRLADQDGKFIPTLVTNTVEEQSRNSNSTIKQENVLRADTGKAPGEGQMLPIQRRVTEQWKGADGQQRSEEQTYSLFVVGVAPDGELHTDRQVSISRTLMADGSTQVIQETAAINPGAKTDRPRPVEKNTEISRRGTAGQVDTKAVIEAPNSSGTMEPFWVSHTHGFTRGKD